jgi:hypothetical protein
MSIVFFGFLGVSEVRAFPSPQSTYDELKTELAELKKEQVLK